MSGRLYEDTKKIKQAYLGVAAFADAIRQADAATALPEVLRNERGPKLTLRGVDFDNQDKNSGKPDGDAEQALKLFAEGYAKGVVPLVALPFTTEREVLFDGLRAASVAMMPSWHEGFGLVAWEAIGAGVPLIISKKSGVHRLLQEVNNGMYTSLYTAIDIQYRQGQRTGRKARRRGQDCCVVLDYAETRQDVLLALLQAVLAKKEKNDKPARHKIRIMLLARDSGEWWDLLPSKNQACEALLSGMAGSGPFTMPDLHDSLANRQQAYQLALRTFADRLQQTAPAHTPRLDDAHFGLPLSIQMAALLALRGERPISAQAPTRALVNYERRYWRNALSGLPGNPEIHAQQAALLMAMATLGNGIAGSRGFEAPWAKAGGDQTLLKTLLHLLTPLYPGHYQGLQGLRPDLLGEALVAQVILGANGAELLSAVLGQADQTRRYASLSVLARHALGPAAAPTDWRDQLARFRQSRQDRLPAWMHEAARRAGFALVSD